MYDICKWKFLQQNNKVTTTSNWIDSFTTVGQVKNPAELNFAFDRLREETLENLNDLYFFKDDVMPMWEDEMNLEGGRLIFEINSRNVKLQEYFEKTAALCFSGLFTSINGLVFNEKDKMNRLCIWLSESSELEDLEAAWKEVLQSGFTRFTYLPHKKGNDWKYSRKKSSGFRR